MDKFVARKGLYNRRVCGKKGAVAHEFMARKGVSE